MQYKIICFTCGCNCHVQTSTRPVQKVSDLWPGKIHLHAWKSATLIPFEVVSLWLNTLLPEVPPLFEAFLECLFANGVQLSRRVPYNVVSWLKSSPFQLCFQVGEQPKNRKEPCFTRSPFLPSLPRRTQYGRWCSFGKRVWFTEITCSYIYSIHCWWQNNKACCIKLSN